MLVIFSSHLEKVRDVDGHVLQQTAVGTALGGAGLCDVGIASRHQFSDMLQSTSCVNGI